MIRWPWVSRLAFDLVCAERDRYIAMLDRFATANVRIERAKVGLPEVEKDPKRPDPMPSTLRDKCMKFGSALSQQNMLSLCERRHSGGVSWEQVEREFDNGLSAARVEDE